MCVRNPDNRTERVTRTWRTPNKGTSELLPARCLPTAAPPHPRRLQILPPRLKPDTSLHLHCHHHGPAHHNHLALDWQSICQVSRLASLIMSPQEHLSVTAHCSQRKNLALNTGISYPAFLGPCKILLNGFGWLPCVVMPQLFDEVSGKLSDSAPLHSVTGISPMPINPDSWVFKSRPDPAEPSKKTSWSRPVSSGSLWYQFQHYKALVLL